MTESIKPLVSVVIPCFNAEEFLADAVQSIREQSYRNIEIVVVDDGSTDRSVSLLQEMQLGIMLLESNHRGTSVARNLGVKACSGDFIAFMDADDVLHPERISIQMERFQTNPDLGISTSAFLNFDKQISAIPSRENLATCQVAKGTLCGTMMVRRDVFSEVGPFNETLYLGEFLEWHLRAQRRGIAIEFLDQVLYFRRIHSHNTSRRRVNFAHFAEVLRANLQLAAPLSSSE